jgi:hypothetical protein
MSLKNLELVKRFVDAFNERELLQNAESPATSRAFRVSG